MYRHHEHNECSAYCATGSRWCCFSCTATGTAPSAAVIFRELSPPAWRGLAQRRSVTDRSTVDPVGYDMTA